MDAEDTEHPIIIIPEEWKNRIKNKLPTKFKKLIF